MRTNLEFRSAELSDPVPGEGVPRGEIVARLLGRQLPEHGFSVAGVFAEDWGWRVAVASDAFPLWIGCGHAEEWADGLLCFIEPRQPQVRRWFKRVPTTSTVERLASAVEAIVRASGTARDIRWWTEEENARG